MASEPDPRVDSAHLTNAFYEQLRSSKDNFLLDDQELTMDHVNRLSTEPEEDADSFAQSKHVKDRDVLRSPYTTAGSDLLPLGSEEADNWDLPSPQQSTTSFGTQTGTHTPLSHLDDESSAVSLDAPTSKRARTQGSTPASTQAVMRGTGTPPSTASSTARAPVSRRSSKQLQAPARSASRRAEPQSRPETPQSALSSPTTRIPKPSPSYHSPNKILGGGSLPEASSAASRIPRPPGTPPSAERLPATSPAASSDGSTAAKQPQNASRTAGQPTGSFRAAQPRVDSASSVAQTGRQMKPAKEYGDKFSQMWSADQQGQQQHTLAEDGNVSAAADGNAAAEWPNAPSRIPSPQKTRKSQPNDDVIMADADDTTLPASRIPAPPQHSNTGTSQPDNGNMPASEHPSVTALRSIPSADSNASSTSAADRFEGRSGPAKPWQNKGSAKGKGEGDIDIYTPTSQKRKEAMSPAEALLHESRPADRVEPGAFTQAMEADKAMQPLTSSLREGAGKSGAAASQHVGVGSRKHAASTQQKPKSGPPAADNQPKCCGCSIM